MNTTPPWEDDGTTLPAAVKPDNDYTMGEFWASAKPVMKAASEEKRQSNKVNSTARLVAAGITFTSNNSGVHLMVNHGDQVVDFWPSTGRWRTRTRPVIDRRGVRELLKYLRGETR
jgi:hypothetical protein